MNVFSEYLLRDTDTFNHKTIMIPQARINVSRNKIFSKNYPFLPAEYYDLLRAFEQNPDFFINIPTHWDFKLQRCLNMLKPTPPCYLLAHRDIWNKMKRVRISLVFVEQKYVVIRDFSFDQKIDMNFALETLAEAFGIFYTNN